MRGPLVVKIGGAALDDPAASPWLWSAISELHSSTAAGALHRGVVLVHGGGKAVDAHLAKLGMTSERREGIRLTPDDQIGVIAGVLAGTVNKSLVGWLVRTGARPVGLCLGDGMLAPCRKTRRYSFDPGRVGEVVGGGDARLVRTLLSEGYLPVISSIGIDAGGGLLNVNADDAAAGVAGASGAAGLVLLTDVPGVLDAKKNVIRTLDRGRIEALIADGTISGGMIPKVRSALDAASLSGVPAIIASWSSADALLALSRGEPAGTTILPDSAAARAARS